MYGYGFEVAKHSLAEYFGLLGAVNGIWSKLNLDDVDLPMRMTRSGDTTLH